MSTCAMLSYVYSTPCLLCAHLSPFWADSAVAVTETCFRTSRCVFVTFRIHLLRTTFVEMLLKDCRNVELRDCLSIQLFLGLSLYPTVSGIVSLSNCFWVQQQYRGRHVFTCILQHIATHCNTLQHAATRYSTV